METRKVVNKSLLQGNNEFETGIITIPAGGTVPEGAFLTRGASGKFKVVSDLEMENPVAINPVELKNSGVAADVPFRACIGGKVRFDMCSVDGEPITDEQGDLLCQYANITAKKVTDLSRDFWE
jgi:hypothetical protein